MILNQIPNELGPPPEIVNDTIFKYKHHVKHEVDVQVELHCYVWIIVWCTNVKELQCSIARAMLLVLAKNLLENWEMYDSFGVVLVTTGV